MGFSSQDRLQIQIIKEISAIVSEELKEKPTALITFTAAEVSKDLRHAKIYFSALGGETEKSESMGFLQRQAKTIRHLLGARMKIRYTPELSFHHDASIENVMRIHEILEQLKRDGCSD